VELLTRYTTADIVLEVDSATVTVVAQVIHDEAGLKAGLMSALVIDLIYQKY